MTKTVIYCRVSTDEQNSENQIPVLTGWAQQLRFNENGRIADTLEVTQIYRENESAWKEGHQRELYRLLSDAAQGRFQVVLVWALDRLTRQGIMSQFELMNKLARYGVVVYSYQETWTLTPTKSEYDLLLAIAAYIAQSSSKRNSERTKAGLARKAATGWKPGRPKGSQDKKQRTRRRIHA